MKIIFTILVLASTAMAQTHIEAAIINGHYNATKYPGSDIGAQINNAFAACTNPRGCEIDIPPGYYSYTTPIVLSSGTYPVTVSCIPGGDSTGSTTGSATLNFTPTSGVAFTYSIGPPGGGINGCTFFGSGTGNSATGLLISGAVGSVFSNLQIGDVSAATHGFNVGLQISTTAGQVYLDNFYSLYIRGNNTNVLMPANGSVTNENLNFFGGVLAGIGGYSATCAQLGNFQMHFEGFSFDSCPITYRGGANSHLSLISPHFEFTNGPTGLDAITVSNTCASCQLTVIDPEIVEDAACTGGCTRTEFFTINGSGVFTFESPQALPSESGVALITANNSNAQIVVINPFLFGGTTVSPVITGTSGSGTVIDHGSVYMNNSNLLISPTCPLTSGLSGFGTSPFIGSCNGTAAFTVNVGTGGAASTGTVTMPASATGWACTCTDVSTESSTVFLCRATPGSTTTIGLANLNTSGASANWASADLLQVNCFAR